jgi:hypothetical protein
MEKIRIFIDDKEQEFSEIDAAGCIHGMDDSTKPDDVFRTKMPNGKSAWWLATDRIEGLFWRGEWRKIDETPALYLWERFV